jgi:hypothetical protein
MAESKDMVSRAAGIGVMFMQRQRAAPNMRPSST